MKRYFFWRDVPPEKRMEHVRSVERSIEGKFCPAACRRKIHDQPELELYTPCHLPRGQHVACHQHRPRLSDEAAAILLREGLAS